MQFEQFVQQFTESINITDFLIGSAVAAPLLILLRLFYIRFGNAVSNRTRFASNFLPLGLTTMLIITIVKSSIALSLGLVGALSIVRFRAAIKDPEELTYLFLCIAIGLACGANEPWIALVGFVIIIGLVLLNNQLSDTRTVKRQDSMYLNIQTDLTNIKQISDTITPSFSYIELKRMDQTSRGLDLSFIVKADSLEDIDKVKEALQALSPNTTLSLVDQPDLGL
ncbi:DUF4956 domain-containing protein [bacterium]|nr:DUF4956 domain-containing protein [bacterium]